MTTLRNETHRIYIHLMCLSTMISTLNALFNTIKTVGFVEEFAKLKISALICNA